MATPFRLMLILLAVAVAASHPAHEVGARRFFFPV
jgi:hypothetical protein